MHGMELDKKMREILEAVTPETALEATNQMIDLGFGALASFTIVTSVLEHKHDSQGMAADRPRS